MSEINKSLDQQQSAHTYNINKKTDQNKTNFILSLLLHFIYITFTAIYV